MPRKKTNEENIDMIDKQDTSSIKEQEQKAENKEIAQINMNNVAYAAFLEFRKNGTLPDKEKDNLTIKEWKAINAGLSKCIKENNEATTYDVQRNYITIMCSLVLAYINDTDLNRYFVVTSK